MSTFTEWLKRSALRSRGRLQSMVGRSRPAPDARIETVLAHWGIDRFHIDGMLGDTSATSWLVDTSRGRYALRRIGCKIPYLDYQVRVMRHLFASDFPFQVPEVTPTSEGADYVVGGEQKWLLYPFIDGEDLPEPSEPTEIRAIGSLVAHYDRAIVGLDLGPLRGRFPLQLFQTQRVERMLNRGARWLADHDRAGALGQAFTRYADAMAAAVHGVRDADVEAISALDTITVYNDWHRYNMVARSGAISGLIDYDSVMEGPRIVDFQNALTYVLIGSHEVDPTRIDAFASGYASVLPLSRQEVELVHPLMVDRVAWLISDILDEVREQGASSRQGLAVQLMRLLAWLGGHRDELSRSLMLHGSAAGTGRDRN